MSMRCAICKLGVTTERQTSSSKICFENVVENLEMSKRAFGDRCWEERKFLNGFSSSKTAGPH
jgi:hypothetical protein